MLHTQILVLDVRYVATSSAVSHTVDRVFELDGDLTASTTVNSDMDQQPERRSLLTILNPFRWYIPFTPSSTNSTFSSCQFRSNYSHFVTKFLHKSVVPVKIFLNRRFTLFLHQVLNVM